VEHFYEKSKQKVPKDFKKQILEQMIEQKILEKEAKKNRIFVTKQEAEDQYQQISLEQGGEEQVQKILSELWGMDLSAFKELIYQQLIKQKMKEEIPIRVRVRHILTKIPEGMNEIDQAEILKKTEAEVKKIEKGKADFASEAKKFSQDEATKDKGGDLGWLARGQANLGDDCEGKIFETPVGQMAICKSKYGFHLLKIEEKKGKVDKTFSAWLKEIKKKYWVWRVLKFE